MIQHKISLWNIWVALLAGIAIVVLPSSGMSQVTATSGEPQSVVQGFKTHLDDDDISGMCAFMAETNRSGPLNRLHYEKTQSSMSELVKLWQYTSFTYNASEIDDAKTPNQAVVRVSAYQLKQEVTFTLLKFGSSWYICDIEIYFK